MQLLLVLHSEVDEWYDRMTVVPYIEADVLWRSMLHPQKVFGSVTENDISSDE